MVEETDIEKKTIF